MIKKLIGFSEIANKQMELYKMVGEFKILNLKGKTNFTDNLFIELDKDYIISLCGINQVNSITEEILKGLDINNNLLKEFNNKLESPFNKVQMNIADYLFDVELIDKEVYERALNHNIMIVEQNKLKERMRAEKELQKEKEKEEQFQKERIEAMELFKNDEMINPEYFIILCEENNINIPIKVKGWLSSKVSAIGKSSYQSSSKSKSIWKYVKELDASI